MNYMSDNILGYDCDNNEIYEYTVLRAIWSNDIAIEELEDADPRQYCAVIGDDGNAYAISVYDFWHKDLIRKRENIDDFEEIPVVVKPISEMKNYEIATCSEDLFCSEFARDKLKEQLNNVIRTDTKQKKLTK